jgi:hypothetical protein
VLKVPSQRTTVLLADAAVRTPSGLRSIDRLKGAWSLLLCKGGGGVVGFRTLHHLSIWRKWVVEFA